MEKIELLKSQSFFQNMTNGQLALIANIAQEKKYQIGELIIKQGQEESNVYCITAGLVKVYRVNVEGKEITLAFRHSNELVGEMSFIDNRARSAYVEALQETTTLILPGPVLKELLLKNSELAISMLQALSLRLRDSNARIEELSSNSLPERTQIVLKTLAQYFPDQKIPLSQEELSSIVNASRPRLTEALHVLENQGKITLDHKVIHVH